MHKNNVFPYFVKLRSQLIVQYIFLALIITKSTYHIYFISWRMTIYMTSFDVAERNGLEHRLALMLSKNMKSEFFTS